VELRAAASLQRKKFFFNGKRSPLGVVGPRYTEAHLVSYKKVCNKAYYITIFGFFARLKLPEKRPPRNGCLRHTWPAQGKKIVNFSPFGARAPPSRFGVGDISTCTLGEKNQKIFLLLDVCLLQKLCAELLWAAV
jgi:hypothetical protein